MRFGFLLRCSHGIFCATVLAVRSSQAGTPPIMELPSSRNASSTALFVFSSIAPAALSTLIVLRASNSSLTFMPPDALSTA
ncbi:MAG: hypothetical protein ACLR4A_11065 [Christensenellales bacterium]